MMLFSSYIFIFLFFPAVFILYALLLSSKKTELAKWALVCGSLFFYAYGAKDFFPFFLGSITFNYLVGCQLLKSHTKHSSLVRRLILTFGILGNITLLGYYKYTDFIIANINLFVSEPLAYQNILLPIGISFFTFQLIAYLVDSYRGETKEYTLLNYLMFITFFPQLIVGPIVHHKDVVPQYNRLKEKFLNYDNIAKGVFLFFIGCTKKIIMADPLSEWAQHAFNNVHNLDMVQSWVAALSYTFAYYFDLSGYADMAIGLGLIFGIKIPENFNSPYKARNFADYWRRWHITLSRFLGDYVFRNVYIKGKGSFNFYYAIFITFLVSGFWHGAGWNFVIWGVVNGIFVISAHMMKRAEIKLPFIIAWFLTFLGIVGTRVLFVSNSVDDSFHVLKTMIGTTLPQGLHAIVVPSKIPVYLAIGFIVTLFFPNSNQMLTKFKPSYKVSYCTALLIIISLFNLSNPRGFLYFQF